MTGSLQEKNGKYYAVINTYIDGKRKQKWVDSGLSTSGPNKTKAQRFLRKTLAEFEKKEHLVHTDILFSDYLYIWLKSKEDKIDAVTYHSYEKMVNTHIAPWFKEKEKETKRYFTL